MVAAVGFFLSQSAKNYRFVTSWIGSVLVFARGFICPLETYKWPILFGHHLTSRVIWGKVTEEITFFSEIFIANMLRIWSRKRTIVKLMEDNGSSCLKKLPSSDKECSDPLIWSHRCRILRICHFNQIIATISPTIMKRWIWKRSDLWKFGVRFFHHKNAVTPTTFCFRTILRWLPWSTRSKSAVNTILFCVLQIPKLLYFELFRNFSIMSEFGVCLPAGVSPE